MEIGIDSFAAVLPDPVTGAQAAADWKAGRMKLPDADSAEFIPLPDAPAMS